MPAGYRKKRESWISVVEEVDSRVHHHKASYLSSVSSSENFFHQQETRRASLPLRRLPFRPGKWPFWMGKHDDGWAMSPERRMLL